MAHDHDDEQAIAARRLLGGRRLGALVRVGRSGLLAASLVELSWVRRALGRRRSPRGVVMIFVVFFGGSGQRIAPNPINVDIATRRLASAIEENVGRSNTVEIGGTQIEREGRIRIAVRSATSSCSDRDRAIVATAPKAEVKLSGTALLMGRLRAESLDPVNAELASASRRTVRSRYQPAIPPSPLQRVSPPRRRPAYRATSRAQIPGGAQRATPAAPAVANTPRAGFSPASTGSTASASPASTDRTSTRSA